MTNPLDPSLRGLNACGCFSGLTAQTPALIDNRPGLSAIAFRVGTHAQFKASLLAALSNSSWLAERLVAAGVREPDLRTLLAQRLGTRADDEFTIALLDGWAAVADVLSFYSERIANESYLRTATERQSLLELARAVGYELNPGVAAAAWLAFTIDEAAGAPGYAQVPRGTKVQSVPGPDEKPQTYETTEAFLARKEWNEFRPVHRHLPPPSWGQDVLRLSGTTTRLKPGDALLIVGDERQEDRFNENWDVRRVKSLATFPAAEPACTEVTLDRGLGEVSPCTHPARANARVFALRQRLNLFGHQAALEGAVKPTLPGLVAEYFRDVGTSTHFVQRRGVRVDSTIDFDWSKQPLPFDLDPTNFSVRWTGAVRTSLAGTYTFGVFADDGVRIWVDGQLLIDEWRDQAVPTSPWTERVTLAADRFYELRVEYYQHPGNAEIHLLWTEPRPGAVAGPIPADRLFHSELPLTSPPALTLAEISGTDAHGQITSLHLEGAHPEIVPGSWLVVSRPGYQELYSVRDACDDARNVRRLSAKTTRVEVDGEQLLQRFNTHLDEITVYAQSEELPRVPSPLLAPVMGDRITLEGTLPELPPGRRLLIRGLPTRVEVAVPDHRLTLTLDGGGTLGLSEGQPLTLLAAPLLLPEGAGAATAPRWTESDLLTPTLLQAELRSPGDRLSHYLARCEPVHDWLEGRRSFSAAFNAVIQRTPYQSGRRLQPLYTEARFAGIVLAPETEQLLAQQPTGTDLHRLNRWLLEDAYPRYLATSRTFRWRLQTAAGRAGFVDATRQQLSFAEADPHAPMIVVPVAVKRVERSVADQTRLVLVEPLSAALDPSSVSLLGNIAHATHGEAFKEVLGDGDGSRTFQRFTLRQPKRESPLTFTPAATASGGESTLELWVNDVRWREVPTLFAAGPHDRVFISRIADDGTVTLQTGDGANGARLPTGQENVRVVYRKGLGAEGQVKPDQLRLLLTRPLGVKAVTNPAESSVPADPQSLEDARRNVPRTALTLDRVVSLQDYEFFARDFAGIAKAHAVWYRDEPTRGVLLTVLGPAGAELPLTGETVAQLRAALHQAGDPLVPVLIRSRAPVRFELRAFISPADDWEPTLVLEAVRQALAQRYSFDAAEFGRAVAVSEVIALMQGIPGVSAVELTRLSRPAPPPAQPADLLLATLPMNGIAAADAFAAELLVLDPASLNTVELAPA